MMAPSSYRFCVSDLAKHQSSLHKYYDEKFREVYIEKETDAESRHQSCRSQDDAGTPSHAPFDLRARHIFGEADSREHGTRIQVRETLKSEISPWPSSGARNQPANAPSVTLQPDNPKPQLELQDRNPLHAKPTLRL